MNEPPDEFDWLNAFYRDLEGCEEDDELGVDVDASPVIQLVDQLLAELVSCEASSLHLLPQADGSVAARLRVSGVLVPSRHHPLASSLRLPLTARLKIVAHLDIAERQRPQRGLLRFGKRREPLRVTITPTRHGELLVLEFLRAGQAPETLAQLGLQPEDLALVQRGLRSSPGLVLACGPRGSGRRTFLWACLRALHGPRRAAMSLDYGSLQELEGVAQVELRRETGFDLADALRQQLHRDHDVLLLCQLDSLECTQLAVQAALDGHWVLARHNTSDAVASIFRLLDMGIEPCFVADSLRLVVACRLLRRLCAACREETTAEPDYERWCPGFLAAYPSAVHRRLCRPAGCEGCGGSGLKGVLPIFESLSLDANQRRLLAMSPYNQADSLRAGLRSLRASALLLAQQGLTSLDEVLGKTPGP